MKKVLSWMLVIGLLCGMMLQTAVPANAMPSAEEQQTIRRMNGLLVGITGDMLGYGDVTNWPDETINRMISNKMQWDKYSHDPWLDTMGIPTDASADGYIHLEQSVVDSLVWDALGRNYVPVELPYMLKVSGNEILFGQAAGEHTAVAVQDYIRQGSYYIAVGCTAWFGGGGSEVEGYFQAVFRNNANSAFGMTLVSLERINGNQNFKKLTAEASSVLSGGDYKAANALDENLSTAWVEGSAGTGIGEFIEFSTTDGSQLNLCAIEVDPGYHKNDDILTKNGWPTKLRIETDDLYLELNCYSTETQTLLFETPSDTEWMRIIIEEAESGSKYTDTCISEIRLIGIDTDDYFRNLDIDLQEDAPAPEDPVPTETEPQPAPETPEEETPVMPEETLAPEEAEDEEETEAQTDGKQIIVLDIMEDWDIAGFLEDNLLLLILVGAGSLVVAAGIAVLIILLRKKK